MKARLLNKVKQFQMLRLLKTLINNPKLKIYRTNFIFVIY